MHVVGIPARHRKQRCLRTDVGNVAERKKVHADEATMIGTAVGTVVMTVEGIIATL